ncbi:thioredoxin family protein [Flavobacteriaceae bacterium TP-CH-4]|uniref:Thioredoxin family protein n=1 Tax=Pelagihabitans pacificus TaxID=2696054 RepID=A0A967E7I4_9FLAO|nr:thioredoxin family protein [Pelagihabitans pacificus]NHF60289.1 thioredoxin family protein [Pelagihabitans pacificus]
MRTNVVFTLAILCSVIAVNCHGQNVNQKVIESNGQEKLLGQVNKIAFMKDSFVSWFEPEFTGYTVDTATLKGVNEQLKKYKIKAFMGTWCGDSKREVPRFYSVLEAAKFPMDQLLMVAVDHVQPNYKKSPGGEEKGLNIVKVPTFIFYKDGKEVNRIIESPVISIEKDMEAIVTGKNYIPNHSKVRLVPMD